MITFVVEYSTTKICKSIDPHMSFIIRKLIQPSHTIVFNQPIPSVIITTLLIAGCYDDIPTKAGVLV